MLVLKLTDELVHPGEHEELQGLEKRRLLEKQHEELQRQQHKEELLKQQEQIRQDQLIRQQKRVARLAERMAAASNARPEESLEKRQPSETGTVSHQDHYKCMVCGKFSKDWTVFDSKTHTCVCSRECLREDINQLLDCLDSLLQRCDAKGEGMGSLSWQAADWSAMIPGIEQSIENFRPKRERYD